jgi:hypothetical protein
MTTRNHNNRSEKQKGHMPVQEDGSQDMAGTDNRQDGKSRHNGGGDGAGGAPKQQGQGQANKGVDNQHQNRGHGGRG